MYIIALGHQKHVGKDTSAHIIRDQLLLLNDDIDIVIRGFAYELKRTCHSLFLSYGLESLEYYERNPSLKDKPLPYIGKTPRDIYIEVGNKLREVQSDVWVRLLLNKCSSDILIIPDLRYHNEVDHILQYNNTLIKVINPHIEHMSDIADDNLLNFTGWNHIINNNGTIKELEEQIKPTTEKIYEQYLEKESVFDSY